MKTREWSNLIDLFYFVSKPPFLDIFKKNSTFTFGAWTFLLVHIRLTPSEEPKDYVIDFLRFQTMNVGPSSRTMEKNHLSWSDFMVHGVTNP